MIFLVNPLLGGFGGGLGGFGLRFDSRFGTGGSLFLITQFQHVTLRDPSLFGFVSHKISISSYLPKRKSCGGFRFGSVNSEQTFWMFWTFLDGFDRSKDRNGESKVSSKV